MVWAPVFRGTPAVPLFIERASAIVPAFAEDPCDEDCCGDDQIPVECCEGSLSEHITFTISGINSGSGVDPGSCEELNGTYIVDTLGSWAGNCAWEYEVDGVRVYVVISGTPAMTLDAFFELGAVTLFAGHIDYDEPFECPASAEMTNDPFISTACESDSGITVTIDF